MYVVTLMLVVMLIGGTCIVWYLVRRYMRQTSNSVLDSGSDAGGANELSAFIAAYRSGRIDATELQAGAAPASAAAPAPISPPATDAAVAPRSNTAPAAHTPPPAKASTPGALLRPEVKLAYLSLRTGLRDHHVFPRIPLSDLGCGNIDRHVDLVVCNSSFAVVAAIDVFNGPAASDPGKDGALRAAGIPYLRLNTRSMPRPADLRSLIYRT